MERLLKLGSFVLFAAVSACSSKSPCEDVQEGCLVLSLSGQGTVDQVDVDLVGADGRRRSAGTFMGAPFALPDRLQMRIDPAAKKSTPESVRLNVRALIGSKESFGEAAISWPDGKTIKAEVDLTERTCAHGWCLDTPNFPDEGPLKDRLLGIWASGPKDVWVTTGKGDLLHHDGKSWSRISYKESETLEPPISLWGVSGISAEHFWIVGDKGSVYLHSKGRWERQITGTMSTIVTVWAVSESEAWAAGVNGIILHYTQSGWTPISSPTVETIRLIRGSASNNIWAVGDNGTIL